MRIDKGNTIGRPFEIDALKRINKKESQEVEKSGREIEGQLVARRLYYCRKDTKQKTENARDSWQV